MSQSEVNQFRDARSNMIGALMDALAEAQAAVDLEHGRTEAFRHGAVQKHLDRAQRWWQTGQDLALQLGEELDR